MREAGELFLELENVKRRSSIRNCFRTCLFQGMINDLLAEWPDRWKYVDDSTAAESVMPDCNSKLQDLVDYIYNWTVKNIMKVNVTKCKEMVVDFSKG